MTVEVRGKTTCRACKFGQIALLDAGRILAELAASAHVAHLKGDRALIQFDVATSLLADFETWNSPCDDCEMGEEFGDSNEPNSQGGLVD